MKNTEVKQPNSPSATEEVTIHDLSRAGSGVAKLPSGQIVFVPLTAPGDKVLIEIPQEKKGSRYREGTVVRLLEKSPQRVEPLCEVFGKCGGCTWQHLPYDYQFEIKKRGVDHALDRVKILETFRRVEWELKPADSPWNYRNRIQLRSEDGKWGFFERGSRRLVPIQKCVVARAEINHFLEDLLKKPVEPTQNKLEIAVRPDGQMVFAKNQKHAATGFRQINETQNLWMRQWVERHAKKSLRIFDFYGGIGNLTLGLASSPSHKSSRVDVVDIGAPRMDDLKEVCTEFQISSVPENVFFWKSPTISFLRSKYAKSAPEPCIIITDPPREGLREDWAGFSKWFNKNRPVQWIHIGCDADSFARDCKAILDLGYTLRAKALVDFFPHTPHIESLAVFEL